MKIVRSTATLPPIPKTGLSHYVLNILENRPENPAIIDGLTGEVTTRSQLAEGILRVAAWMKQEINAGDIVAVSLPNSSSYLLPVLGSIHAGGVPTLFNPNYTPSENKHALALTKPKLIVTSEISLAKIKEVVDDDVRIVLLASECPSGIIPFSDLLKTALTKTVIT
jgi:acyl-CoA synthetase (AMP-forming)/AMP-acid ligase II